MKSKKEQAIQVPKPIIYIAKTLQFLSPKLVTLFAAKLFTTPIKHKIPKRELEMDKNSQQELLKIPSINKEVVVYQYGKSDKKILLVHGWSGRGTQLVKFADELVKSGYSTISFDAPAHGKSSGKTTIMTEFIASVLEIQKKHGPFEAAIGHSLGGMTLLNAIKRGLKLKHLAIIGSGDKVQDIMDDFVAKLQLKPEISNLLRIRFENQFGETMDSYSAYIAAKEIEIPVLVIHDENDYEVPVKAGIHIHQQLKNGELMLTKGLGHRKILGDHQVIKKVINFITK
ncbi:alpha/beta hydrolase [Flavobacterium sp.]|uniref:alpha/beta hydrolase n=1 Tax=Flavobacterium sp. TaxID=239 RepID=UPI002B4AB137|nr:alpha/beta hydrolase [Flavobacterium sp.]HLF53277.1 alpha/beta hydrolase [Flavobacterium sp.]